MLYASRRRRLRSAAATSRTVAGPGGPELFQDFQFGVAHRQPARHGRLLQSVGDSTTTRCRWRQGDGRNGAEALCPPFGAQRSMAIDWSASPNGCCRVNSRMDSRPAARSSRSASRSVISPRPMISPVRSRRRSNTRPGWAAVPIPPELGGGRPVNGEKQNVLRADAFDCDVVREHVRTRLAERRDDGRHASAGSTLRSGRAARSGR